MNIRIEIECGNIGALEMHLDYLLEQIEKHQALSRLHDDDTLTVGTRLEDRDEYGRHKLVVIENF